MIRRLVMVLLAVGMLTAVAAPVAAVDLPDEPPDATTMGSDLGWWNNNREWRFFTLDAIKKCPLGTNPTVGITTGGIRPAYTDVDHALIQVEFDYHNLDPGPFKEKIVGWYPSLIGEYKFQVSEWPAWRKLKFRHRYTGEVPFQKMQVQGPNGGWVRGIWAAVSWNASVTEGMPSQVRFKVTAWCA